jgi:hypothetical protein
MSVPDSSDDVLERVEMTSDGNGRPSKNHRVGCVKVVSGNSNKLYKLECRLNKRKPTKRKRITSRIVKQRKAITMDTKLPSLERETTGLKLFPLFTLSGLALIGTSILIGLFVLAPTAGSYWGANAKAVRDGAEVGSALLASLTTLAWWPKVLAPLTFLGVSMMMVGIALEFAAIPGILDRRVKLLKQALPLMGSR